MMKNIFNLAVLMLFVCQLSIAQTIKEQTFKSSDFSKKEVKSNERLKPLNQNFNQTKSKSAKNTYCIPNGAQNNTDEIINFTLGDLNNTSAPSEGIDGYSDYTQTVAPANLLSGDDYIANLTSGTGSLSHGAAIWIDYDDNGVFALNEMVSFIEMIIFPSETHNFPAFTVQNYPGVHRLRVQYTYDKSGANLDPCLIPNVYSETEDYLINISSSLCSPVSLPYTLDFETLEGDGYPLCTSTQNFGGSAGWYVANANLFDSYVLTCTYDEQEDIDAWFYTRAFNVVEGETYSISFDYANNSSSYTENLKVLYGFAPDKNLMLYEIVDLPNINDAIIHNYSSTFEANYTGLCYVGFNSYSPADQWLLYVDNILIEDLSGCIYPENINASNITESTASLEWTHLRPEDVVSYEIFYSTSDIAPDETTTPTAVSNSTNYTLTELSHSTDHYVWIRANCVGGGISPWSAVYSFSTLCSVFELPYFENFENLTDIPNCTSIENLSNGNDWIVTYNSNFDIYTLTYNYSSFYSADAWFYTPQFELEQNKSYKFSCTYFAKSNAYPENLKIAYGTSPSHIDMTNIIVDMPDIVHTSPTTFETIITPTATDVYTLGFNCYSLEDQYTLYVTDISLIEEVSECTEPENLSLLELNVNYATIQWDEPNTPTFSGFDVYYSNSENAPDDSTSPSESVEATQTTYTINNLNSNTTYYAWVRSYCDETTFSEWLGPISFTTACNSTTIPYELNFETANPPEMPNCVNLYNAGTGNNWQTEQNPGHGFDNMTIKYKANYSNVANAIFYTQALELQGGTTYNLMFKYGNNSQTKAEKLKVAYTQNLFENINSNIIADLDNITGASANTYIAEFTPLLSGNYFIAFNCYSDKNQAELYIDDIMVDYATGCTSPNNINLVSVSNNSVKITWNEPIEPVDSYDIYLSTSSTEPNETTSPTLTIDGSETSCQIDDLQNNTTYYLWLRSNCGDAGLGAWKHVSFTTACGTISHFPFKENFNYNTFPPECWSLNTTNEYGTWKHNPENGGYAEVLYGLNQDEWLVTPPMSFVNVKDPKLSFKWLMSYVFSVGDYDNYDLNCWITTNHGTTWTLLWNEEDFGEFENFQWNTTEIDLSNFINEENVVFAWQYIGNDGARAGLDNILIEATALIEANTFPKYKDFDIDNPHDVIATIEWNDATSVVQVVDNQNGAYVLVDGLDYEVSNDSLIIKSEYLAANLTENNQISELHIDFDFGNSYLIITSTKISVEQFNALEFKIYPNPNKGEFIIELQQNAEMFITDILGKVIMSKSLNNGENYINIFGQAAGTYFVNLIDQNSIKTFRIIIE